MPSEFDDFINAGIADVLEQCGEPITFRGETYSAIIGELGIRPEFVMGGEAQRKSCTIELAIPSPAFDPEPRKGERLSARGGELEIVSFTKDETTYRLECAEVFRK